MQESTLSILMKRMYFRNVFLALAMVLSISMEVCAAVKIRGKVTDEKNDPMEFVTVRIAGTALGATTGLDGGYNISAADADTIRVIFSCIGYMESKRTLIGAKGDVTVNVKMEPSSHQLQEPDTHRDFGAVAEACAERYDKRDVSRADETCRGNREMQGNTGNYFRYTEPQAFFVRESCTYHPKSSGSSGGGHRF